MLMRRRPLIAPLLLIALVLASSALPSPAQTWSGFAGGANDWVYATTVWNGDLVAGGKFTSIGGVSASHVARWNGTAWAPLGPGLSGDVWALAVFQGNLVAAGFFQYAGSLEVWYIAQWDGFSWSDLSGGANGPIVALTVYGNRLIAGGYYTSTDVAANHVSAWDGSDWFALGSGTGGSQGQVMALTVHGTDLFAGGFFTSAGGAPANHIARWDGAAWSPLGTGISGIVYSLTSHAGSLVAGGLFTSAGGSPAQRIARWDGVAWSAFGSGISGGPYGYVLALAVYNGDLVAGGIYTTAGGAPANNVAKWNGYAWSPLASGTFNGGSTSGVYALTPFGSDLAAGGIFNSAGSTNVGHVAAWNEAFSAFGIGCPGSAGTVPVLAGTGWPAANMAAGVALTNGVPFGAGFLFLADAAGSTSVMGCTFLLGGTVLPAIPVTLNGAGALSMSWVLPPAVAAGAQIFAQYGGIDPGALNGLFSASNGLKATLQ